MITKEEIYKDGKLLFGSEFKDAARWLCEKLWNDAGDMGSAMDLIEEIAFDYWLNRAKD